MVYTIFLFLKAQKACFPITALQETQSNVNPSNQNLRPKASSITHDSHAQEAIHSMEIPHVIPTHQKFIPLPQYPITRSKFSKNPSLTNEARTNLDYKIERNPYASNVASPFCYTKDVFLKIDVSEIQFLPANNHIFATNTHRLSMLFRYARESLSLCFSHRNNVDEIKIAWKEIVGCWIMNRREIEIEFCKNFIKEYKGYLRTVENPKPRAINRSIDPTNGRINGSNVMVITPTDNSHPNTIMMIYIGIQRICFGYKDYELPALRTKKKIKHKESKKKQVIGSLKESQSLSKVIRPDEVFDLIMLDKPHEEDQPLENDINALYITLFFFIETRILLFPSDGTFSELLQKIKNRFHVDVNAFEYKNFKGDVISVGCQEIWKFVVSKVRMEGDYRISVNI